MKKKNALVNLKLRTGIFVLLSLFGMTLSLYAIYNIVFILSVGWAFPEPNIGLNIALVTLIIGALLMLGSTGLNAKKFWQEWQGRNGSVILSENYAHLTDESNDSENDLDLEENAQSKANS